MLHFIDSLITPNNIFFTGLFLIGLGSLHRFILKLEKNELQI